jgi:hypothetical protein
MSGSHKTEFTGVAVIVTVTLVLAGCGGLSSSELKRQVDVVDSTAAEGGLLADRVADNDIRDSFTRVHAGELADSMDHTVAKLHETEEQGDVDPQLQEGVKQAIQLASNTSDALQELELNPSDPDQAHQAGIKFHDIGQSARKLSDQL